MNISKTVSGIKIQPSFKLWWNKYNLKFDKYVSNSIINERDFAFWLNLYNKYNS